MARKRTTSRKGGVTVVRESARAAAPIVVTTSAAPARRRSGGRRSVSKRRRSGGRKRRFHAPAATLSNTMVGLAAGGAVLGFVEKHFGDKIPHLPLIGRKGAIALAVYLLKPKNAWIQDAGKAAAAISGYELGTTGKVTGAFEQM